VSNPIEVVYAPRAELNLTLTFEDAKVVCGKRRVWSDYTEYTPRFDEFPGRGWAETTGADDDMHLLRLGDVEIYRPTEDFWDILVLFMIMRDNNPLEYIIPLYSDGLGTFFFYLEMEGSGGEAR
jgi:hypothetical protein